MSLLLALLWTQPQVSESSSSGDHGRPVLLGVLQDSHHLLHHHQNHQSLHRNNHQNHQNYQQQQQRSVPPPAAPESRLHLEPEAPPLQVHQEVQPEQVAVSAQHLVIMYLAVDVRRLNATLLRWFREGVAAALGVPAGHVHINRLNEKKNGVELFVSSDRKGTLKPRPADEVIHSLDIGVLHRHLGHFGITEVSSEKNVLQLDHGWDRDQGFYTIVLFFTVFTVIIICLMVLYRVKEKVPIPDRHLKAPPLDLHLTHVVPAKPAQGSKVTKVSGGHLLCSPPQQAVAAGSMVQAELPPAAATPTPWKQPIIACHRPAAVPPPSPAPAPAFANSGHAPLVSAAPAPANHELRPCPSPFKMKPAAGLQERRGSNVSLVLDMSALGAVEPLSVAATAAAATATVVTPREAAAREFLLSAGRPISRLQLRQAVGSAHRLHAEFAEIPMNFTEPSELDVPNHGTKNRYKTILPNPHSRVILKPRMSSDLLASYINANYIRGYLGQERAFIATQGPMVNTVNDFWHMAWQEAAPAIVMITKLKEKNEKCVLYWPERRGIYGRVEVLVHSVRECEHYTRRSLTLQCGGRSCTLQHYWYTSWPDHKTPDSTLPLLQLMADVEAERRASASGGPVIVHCSAGIGRTGCFIATTIGCRQLQTEGVVDMLGITCQLRADRGGMIQTGEQYEFVHHALSLYESRLPAQTGQ